MNDYVGEKRNAVSKMRVADASWGKSFAENGGRVSEGISSSGIIAGETGEGGGPAVDDAGRARLQQIYQLVQRC